jgi:3-dehydroquinate synthase|tara:strand:+ start:14385 stop:15464 length:1080 start_codon:yes stop_codon:yes gene_type:complete
LATLNVELGKRSYPIVVGNGLLRDEAFLDPYLAGEEAVVVTNESVAPLYLDRVAASLKDHRLICQVLPDGEQFKNFETLQSIFDTLLENRCSRSATLIALGGGVIGDVVGFAAACYQRGVAFIQLPTTLLAQVDSAVGGKTAVNHPCGKNMIGAFHQPTCVVSDTETLRTLDQRQLSTGIAEVIKYGLIRDAGFFAWLEENIERLLRFEDDALEFVILESCRHKAQVVANDEKEAGERALLNLGHTFGHAIEAATGYCNWLHGEAVAVGMMMAATMSQKMGWLDPEEPERIRELLVRANLPVKVPDGMSAPDFLKHMALDKKVSHGRIRLVLLKRIGAAILVSDYPDGMLDEVLAEYTG